MVNTYAEKPRDSQLSMVLNLALSLLHDAHAKFISYSDVELQKDIATLEKRACYEGLPFFTHTLPNLSKGLLNHLEYNSGKYPNFALKGAYEYPAFLSGIFKLAYEPQNEYNVDAIGFIYQFSNSFKKLKGPYDELVLRKQMEDFLEVDASLPEEFSECDYDIISKARDFLRRLFAPINECDTIFFNNIVPRPGPGATNTPVVQHKRYRYNNIYTQLNSFFSYDEWFYPTYHEFSWDIPYFKQKYENQVPYPRARFKFVDKIVGKARGICIEENEMQYFQQGVKHFLYKWIEQHPLTEGHINFTYQSVNANLALASSSNLSYATLDMKDASDRISRKLVDILFEDVPVLKDALLHLSTREIDVTAYSDVGHYACKKYAAMGSGLCFPVMSLVHYALIHAIIDISMHPNTNLKKIYVYGDDIIVPTSCAQAIFDWLPRFGMKLNRDKSFVSSRFRESCGIHAYNGVDITPVYFKYTPERIHKTDALYSLIANEALLYTKGYYRTAAFIRKYVTLPYVNERSPACGWKRPQHILDRSFNDLTRYRKRCCVRYQRVEYLVYTFKEVKSDRYTTDDNCMYLRALLTKSHKHDDFWARSFVKKQRVWLPINMIK